MINLARHAPDAATVEEVTRQAEAELREAQIRAHSFPLSGQREVPSKVVGSLYGWIFERAWVYWIAKGPGLPVEVAERLHASHGTEVRVDGHCGAPSPREMFHGFGVGHYHIDSQAGLNALAAALRSVVESAAAPPSGVDREAVDKFARRVEAVAVEARKLLALSEAKPLTPGPPTSTLPT